MKKIYFALMLLVCSALAARAQYNTLFDYPVAPDSCSTLESRCNYSTTHFWDKFEFGRQLTNDKDSLLLTAMYDYLSIMGQANVNVGKASIRLLMNKAQSNQTNFMKLLSAAEYILYITNSMQVIDDVYLSFLQSASESTWMKKDVKAYYNGQIKRINNSKLGQEMYNLSLTDASGSKKKLNELPVDSAEIVFVMFTDDDNRSAIARTRTSADLGVNQLLQKGYAKMVNVYVGSNPKSFFADASLYPDWTLVATDDLDKIDVRFLPDFFILDKSHRVMNKNITIEHIKQAFN